MGVTVCDKREFLFRVTKFMVTVIMYRIHISQG